MALTIYQRRFAINETPYGASSNTKLDSCFYVGLISLHRALLLRMLVSGRQMAVQAGAIRFPAPVHDHADWTDDW